MFREFVSVQLPQLVHNTAHPVFEKVAAQLEDLRSLQTNTADSAQVLMEDISLAFDPLRKEQAIISDRHLSDDIVQSQHRQALESLYVEQQAQRQLLTDRHSLDEIIILVSSKR